MFKNCLLVLISICIGIPMYSQSGHLLNDYYVTISGDTVKGSISLKDTAKEFRIKKAGEDKYTSVPFASCRYLNINSQPFYVKTVVRSLVYVDKFDYTIRYKDSSQTETIPLAVIYIGTRFSLYYYKADREHFFIDDSNETVELLIQYRYSTEWEKRNTILNPPTYFTYFIFRDQILAKAGANISTKLKNRILAAEYEKSSLIKLFKALNK